MLTKVVSSLILCLPKPAYSEIHIRQHELITYKLTRRNTRRLECHPCHTVLHSLE